MRARSVTSALLSRELAGAGRSPAIASLGAGPTVAWLAGDTVPVALASVLPPH